MTIQPATMGTAQHQTMQQAQDAPGTLIVFSDDWGRHPSSCQHLIGRLQHRYRIIWVNTIGLRPPGWSFETLTRGAEKLGQWLLSRPTAVAAADNPLVLNPRMWPWFKRSHDRSLNRRLLLRSLTPVLASCPRPVLGITTIPIVADLVSDLPVDRWMYYCVDDFSVWPGLDQQTLLTMEAKLIERVDQIVAVSRTLQDRLAALGRPAELLTHGVDSEAWRPEGTPRGSQVATSSSDPCIVFWGVVDRRMDTEFVRRLAAELPGGCIKLVGPHQDPDPELLKLPHVEAPGPVAWDQLPMLAQQADVLIMPYIDAEVTRAMQPLKLKEYLATGKPVVVRSLPSTRDWDDCLDVATTPEEFSRSVQTRIETGVPPRQVQARTRLVQETWDNKARQFEQFLLSRPDRTGNCS